MVTSTFLYDIKNEIKGNISVDNIVTTIIVGGNDSSILSWYDSTMGYKRGDVIPYITEDGKLIMLVCKEDGVTGEFDINKWEEYNLVNELKLMNDEYIELSPIYPTNTRVNKVWLQVKSESVGDIEGIGTGILIYNNFIVSERKPNNLIEGVIWGKVTETIE